MLIAYNLEIVKSASALIAPAPVPSNYKTREAIEKHNLRARDGVKEKLADTAACLQPTGLLIQLEKHGVVDGKPIYHQGSPSTWMLTMLGVIGPTERIWCFRAELFSRTLALSCLRLGVTKVPGSLLQGINFCDPFETLFGRDKNLDRAACLLSIGIQRETDASLEEQLRVLSDCVSRIGAW